MSKQGTQAVETDETKADRAAQGVADHNGPTVDYKPARTDADVVLAGEPLVLSDDEKARLSAALKAEVARIRDTSRKVKGWRINGYRLGTLAGIYDLRKVWSFIVNAKAKHPAEIGTHVDYPKRSIMVGADWNGRTDSRTSIWIGFNSWATDAAKGGRGGRVHQASDEDQALVDGLEI